MDDLNTTNFNRNAKFDPGQICFTPGALAVFAQPRPREQSFESLLMRHAAGDFGDLDEADCRANEIAMTDGNMILSSYRLDTETTIWIISDPVDDAGRRVTTVLLPEER
ncbi:MAG TPA: hypothetical protein VFD70_24935 [Anaerolineae bacterium]|nr:hypothetical protein [Anaerolineae bacterium]